MIAARLVSAPVRWAASGGASLRSLGSRLTLNNRYPPTTYLTLGHTKRFESSEVFHDDESYDSDTFSIADSIGLLGDTENRWGFPKPLITFHEIECPNDAFNEVIIDPQMFEQVEHNCGGHWYRKIQSQKDALKGIINARRTDCGPKGIHWRWYRDRRIKIKKQKNYI